MATVACYVELTNHMTLKPSIDKASWGADKPDDIEVDDKQYQDHVVMWK